MLSKHLAVLLIVLSLVFLSLAGCSDRNGPRERLERTIRELEQQSGNEEVLRELKKATLGTLKTPQLIHVDVIEQRESVRLFLEWIEVMPTPDTLLVRNAKTGYEKAIPFDRTYLDENTMLSESSVLFRFVHAFEPDSSEWKEFRKQIADGQAEAVLTKNGKPLSNTMPVELRQIGAGAAD